MYTANDQNLEVEGLGVRLAVVTVCVIDLVWGNLGRQYHWNLCAGGYAALVGLLVKLYSLCSN